MSFLKKWSNRVLKSFKNYDRVFILLILILLFVGVLTLYSASIEMPSRVIDQVRNIAFTLILIWIISGLSPQTLMRFAVPLYAIGIILLISVELFGITKKGARRWINLGFIFQPSEVMKIATPLMLAWYYQLREGSIRWFDHVVGLVLLVIPVLLIASQPDLGTALLVATGGFFVIYFSGLSFRVIIPILTFIILFIVFTLTSREYICQKEIDWPLLHNYQKHRICIALDPSIDPLGRGFHTTQSIIAIGSGGFFGKGWLKGSQAHLEFIPEKHTDFIFAVFCEEFGFFGVIMLFFLYFLIIIRGLFIAIAGTMLFGRLLAAGIIMTFFTYAFVNISMVGGVLPVVGVPLPMVSYGGTALVTLGVGIGIILSLGKQRRQVDI